jgi:hypothetical protein
MDGSGKATIKLSVTLTTGNYLETLDAINGLGLPLMNPNIDYKACVGKGNVPTVRALPPTTVIR